MSSQQDEETFHGKNGKIYAAYVAQNPDDPFNSKPLCAALLSPGDLHYNQIKYACNANGYSLLSHLLLKPTMELSMSALTDQFAFYTNERLNTFRKASKTKCSSIPILDSGIISGSSFIEKAINKGIFRPDTAAKCGLNSSTSSQTSPARRVTDHGYSLTVESEGPTSKGKVVVTSASNFSNQTEYISDDDLDKGADDNNTLTKEGLVAGQNPTHPDPVQMAMNTSGILFPLHDGNSIGAFVTVGGSQAPAISSDNSQLPSQSQAGSTNAPNENHPSIQSSSHCQSGSTSAHGEGSQPIKEGSAGDMEASLGDKGNNPREQRQPDDDRLIEDTLLQVEALDTDIKDHPVVKALCEALKRSNKSRAEKDKRISSLLRLAMAAEARINAFLKGEAHDLIDGLKSALDDTKKDIVKSVGEEMKSCLDNTNNSIANLTAKVVALKISSKKIDDTTTIIDNKLSVSGFVVKENPLEQVDVPEVLLQVNNRVNGSPFSFPPPPVPSFPGSQPDAIPPRHAELPKWTPEGKGRHTPGSSTWPKSAPKVGLNNKASTTPLHRPPPTSSSLLTPAPSPCKKVRWAESTQASSIPHGSATPSRPTSARSLSAQLNSCGDPNTDENQKLFDLMTKAKGLKSASLAYSLEQIEERASKYEEELKNMTEY